MHQDPLVDSTLARSPFAELRNWRVVPIGLADANELKFEPVVITAHTETTGESLWAARSARGDRIGIAFPWLMTLPRVPLVADPVKVVTNAALSDQDGPFTLSRRMIWMMTMLYNVPWQAEVLRRKSQ